LFWPLSNSWFGVLNIDVTSLPNVLSELALFFLTLPIIYKLGDLKTLLKPHNNNWALIIPLGAVLGSLLTVGRGQEAVLPLLLVVPSLFYVVLFGYSMFVEFKVKYNQGAHKLKPINTPFVFSSFKTTDSYYYLNQLLWIVWLRKRRISKSTHFR